MPAAQTLIKQPAESRLYTMDFSQNLASGVTLSSVTSVAASPSGLTLSGAAAVSNDVYAQQQISGGTAGIVYTVTFVVVDSQGNTLEGEGKLQVRSI